jgi:RNA 2',3'-cyclic 3'-phosphodiesterase
LTTEPRLFIGLPLDATARDRIAAIVEQVRGTEPAGRGVRWVRLDGLHLTLRFLGPTPESRIADLAEAISAAAADTGRIGLRIAGAGAFPARGRPRALWLGITDGADRLGALAARVEAALERAGWPREERPFRPHLTLARADGVRSGPDAVAALAAAVGEMSIDATVDRIVLFESITGSGPARYEPRAEASLA